MLTNGLILVPEQVYQTLQFNAKLDRTGQGNNKETSLNMQNTEKINLNNQEGQL